MRASEQRGLRSRLPHRRCAPATLRPPCLTTHVTCSASLQCSHSPRGPAGALNPTMRTCGALHSGERQHQATTSGYSMLGYPLTPGAAVQCPPLHRSAATSPSRSPSSASPRTSAPATRTARLCRPLPHVRSPSPPAHTQTTFTVPANTGCVFLYALKFCHRNRVPVQSRSSCNFL